MTQETQTVHMSYYPALGMSNNSIDRVTHIFFDKDEPFIKFSRTNGQTTRIAASAVIAFDVITDPLPEEETNMNEPLLVQS